MLRQYGLYLVRWQLSTPILAAVLFVLSWTDTIVATIVANLIGGLVFFWIDRFIFRPHRGIAARLRPDGSAAQASNHPPKSEGKQIGQQCARLHKSA